MLKFNQRCNACLAVKENQKLLNDIFNSSFYLGKGRGDSLMKISERTGLKYEPLRNHCKNHQFMSEKDYTNRHLNKIAKQAEQSIIKRTIESKEVFDEVIGQGMEQLQAGDMDIGVKDLISAARFKKEFQLKEQDQQLAVIEMVMHFASGENNESRAYDRRVVEGQAVSDYDPATESPEGDKRRTDQSRAFYQSLAGDAPAPGTN